MKDILFDRDTLEWSGTDREKQPYELTIRNVDTTDLIKTTISKVGRSKVDEFGNPLYILPQPDLIQTEEVFRTVTTTEKTDTPAYESIPVERQVMKDGKPVTYRRSKIVTTTEDTGEKVMERVVIDDVISLQQKVDIDGNPLFYKKIPVGPEIPYKTRVVEEVHITSEDGKPLYYKDIKESRNVVIEQPPLEITKRDPRYKPGLNRAVVFEDIESEVHFDINPESFTYNEIVEHKLNIMLEGTFSTSALLYEKMGNLFISTNGGDNGTIKVDSFILPKNTGSLITKEIELPESTKYVTLVPQFVKGGEIVATIIGDSGEEVTTNSRYEAYFPEPVDSITIRLSNVSEVDVEVDSLGILL